MKRVRIAVLGAVLAAGLVGGSAVALTQKQAARQFARCTAATARVNSVNAYRNTLDPNTQPVEFAIASSLLQKALQKQAQVC